MEREFRRVEWDAQVEDDCRQLVRLAVREDLDRYFDWTSVLLVRDGTLGQAAIAAREGGVLAGLPAAAVIVKEYDRRIEFNAILTDGATLAAGDVIARIRGPARSLLAAERPLLNMLARLSGIATLTRKFVEAVSGTNARVFDTRKTTPGYRRLEKYAVAMGGGRNHRTGLFDGILIKDNHLAIGASGGDQFTPAEAVTHLKELIATLPASDPRQRLPIEIEVDSLEQLESVLPTEPDLVLLDNMPPEKLRRAVEMRNQTAPQVELEASGGVSLATIRAIAETGVERISAGALTHGARWLDLGLDWAGLDWKTESFPDDTKPAP